MSHPTLPAAGLTTPPAEGGGHVKGDERSEEFISTLDLAEPVGYLQKLKEGLDQIEELCVHHPINGNPYDVSEIEKKCIAMKKNA